jgi:uncharacterized membrane protein YccC
VAPLAAAYALGLGGATWMSLAGFSGALADKGGPYRTRAFILLNLAVAGAAAAAVGALAGPHPSLAIPVTFIVAALCSLGRAYGEPGATVGVLVLNTYVISLGYAAASPGESLARAGYVVAGGSWAMLLSLVFWPLRPYRPVRLALGAAYRAVAAYGDEVSRWLRTGARPGPVRVRRALETARAALASVRRGRPGESGRGERLLVLGETADQVFGHLFGLSEMGETATPGPAYAGAHAILADAVTSLGVTLRALADEIENEGRAASVATDGGGGRLRAALPPAGDASDGERGRYEQAASLLDRMAQYTGVAAAVTASLNDGRPVPEVVAGREPEPADPPVPLLGPVRAALTWESVIFRFALRVGLVTAAAVALTAALDLRRGYWVTITAVLILQPYVGATSTRALQRVLGTIVGGMLTAVLAALFHAQVAILILVGVFAWVSVALLPLNYAAFSVFLTPTFVLLAEASAGDWHLAGLRITNTILGGGLALGGSRLLWPTPEAERTPAYLGAALRALGAYLDDVVARFDDRGERASRALRARRRSVGLAILNADESLQRSLGEHRGPAEDLAPLMTLATYIRRLTASVAALALSRHQIEPLPVADLSGRLRPVGQALEDLAEALERERPPAPLGEGGGAGFPEPAPLLRERVARLERQVRILHDAVARWHDGAAQG